MKRICFVLTCLLFFSLVLLVLYPAGQAHAQRTWSGQVLDVRTNLPVEGAVVYAGILGRADLVPPVTTGADGTFSLTYSEEQWKWFLPPSEECPSCGAFFNANHYLRVLSPATRPDWGNPYMHGYHMATFIRTSPVENLTVSLVPQFAFFRGRVVSANNTPIAGARVYLGYKTVGASAYTVGIPGSYGAWVHSDLDGYFTFSPDGPENANLFTGLHPKSWLVRPYEEYPFGFTETLFDIAPNVVPRDPNEEPGGFSDLQTRRRETGPYLAFGYRNWEWGDWFDIPQGQITTSVNDSRSAYREIVGFPIDWLGNMSQLRQYVNQPYTMVITGSASGNVWGTDIYTHDSSLAAAAVHAGVVGVGETRTVIVRVLPGQSSYTGSTRNGITSMTYDRAYDGSFEFLSGGEDINYTLTVNSTNPASGVAITSSSGHGGTTSYTQTVEQNLAVTLTAPEYHGSGANRKRFDRWSADVSSTNRTITLYMDQAKTVTANYVDDPVTSLPPRVTLRSPANNATMAGRAVTFRWNAARGATMYQVQIRRANGTVFKNRTLGNLLQLRQAGFRTSSSYKATVPWKCNNLGDIKWMRRRLAIGTLIKG